MLRKWQQTAVLLLQMQKNKTYQFSPERAATPLQKHCRKPPNDSMVFALTAVSRIAQRRDHLAEGKYVPRRVGCVLAYLRPSSRPRRQPEVCCCSCCCCCYSCSCCCCCCCCCSCSCSCLESWRFTPGDLIPPLSTGVFATLMLTAVVHKYCSGNASYAAILTRCISIFCWLCLNGERIL